MMIPGSLFVRSSHSNYLKMFVSSNYAFEVYVDYSVTQLCFFADSTIARFYQVRLDEAKPKWIKIS